MKKFKITPHTPLPWGITRDNYGCKSLSRLVPDPDPFNENRLICTTEIGHTSGLANEAEDKSNCDYALVACNNFEVVLDALKVARRLLPRRASLPRTQTKVGDTVKQVDKALAGVRKNIRQLRAVSTLPRKGGGRGKTHS